MKRFPSEIERLGISYREYLEMLAAYELDNDLRKEEHERIDEKQRQEDY